MALEITSTAFGLVVRLPEKTVGGFRVSTLKKFVLAPSKKKQQFLALMASYGLREKFMAAFSAYMNPRAGKGAYQVGRGS